ncbi:MAG: hypothetical protein WBD40_06975 [Tepidisphaeraceae bacterium]
MSTATPASTPANPPRTEPDAAAIAVLRELCGPLRGGASIDPVCVVVQPNEIPHPADALLVHHEHMTEVLQRRYGRPVDVYVLDEHLEGSRYTRKVKLTPSGGGPVVEWGVVRLDFRFMSDAVRDEILAKRSPLGAILIKHNVHRRIKPRWFMRFPARGPTLTWFGETGDQPMYGRIGTIYCDEEPAIELLEIVTVAPVGSK